MAMLSAPVIMALSLTGLSTTQAALAADPDPKPGMGEVWPMCGALPDSDGQYCVVSQTKNGQPIVHPDTGVYQRPEIDLIGDGVVRFGVSNYENGSYMTVDNGAGGLMVDADISPLDVYEVTVNTGAIVPRELYGHFRNVTYSTGGGPGSGHTFTMQFQGTPLAWVDPAGAVPCSVDGCGDDQTVADWVYDGFVTGYVSDLEHWEDAEERVLRTGLVRAYNAQDADIAYDAVSNLLVVRLANPHLRAPGEVATGSYQTFLPYPMLTDLMDVPDPASLSGGSFSVTRLEDGTTVAVPFTLTHLNSGVQIDIADVTYSTPEFRIKPKRTVPGRPRLKSAERVAPLAVKLRFRPPLATGGSPIIRYKARCQRPDGAWFKAAGKKSPIVVKPVPRKKVSCSVRAVNKLGPGPWSRVRRA